MSSNGTRLKRFLLYALTPLCVGALLVGVLLYKFFAPIDCESENETKVLTQSPGGYEVVSYDEGCTGYFSLALQERGVRSRTVFYATNNGDSDPRLSWLDRNTLAVRLVDVGTPSIKRDKVGDLRVIYQIGYKNAGLLQADCTSHDAQAIGNCEAFLISQLLGSAPAGRKACLVGDTGRFVGKMESWIKGYRGDPNISAWALVNKAAEESFPCPRRGASPDVRER